jgi:hypothetical protein
MVALAYLVLSLAYGLVNPPFESPDEIHHYDYIEELLRTRRLPVAELGAGANESHQPPLYYVAAALLTAWIPVETPAHAVVQRNPFWGWRIGEVGTDNKNQYRGSNLSLYHQNLVAGTRCVLFLLRAGRGLAGGEVGLPWRESTSAGRNGDGLRCVCRNSCLSFVFISSSITMTLGRTQRGGFTTSRWLLEPQGPRLAMGLDILAARSSRRACCFSGGTPRLLLYLFSMRSTSPRKRLAMIGAIGGLPALIAAPLACRNWLMYGDPTALSRMDAIWGRREPPLSLSQTLATEVPNTWTSFWARFGYGQIPVPEWVYGSCLLLVALGAVGCLYALRRELRAMAVERRWVLGFLVLVLGLFVAATFRYSQTSLTGAQGRFLFPSLSAIGLLLAMGWLQIGAWLGVTSLKLGAAFAVAWFGFALWALLTILRPAYVAPITIVALDDLSRSSGVRIEEVALVRRVAVLDPPLSRAKTR